MRDLKELIKDAQNHKCMDAEPFVMSPAEVLNLIYSSMREVTAKQLCEMLDCACSGGAKFYNREVVVSQMS